MRVRVCVNVRASVCLCVLSVCPSIGARSFLFLRICRCGPRGKTGTREKQSDGTGAWCGYVCACLCFAQVVRQTSCPCGLLSYQESRGEVVPCD